MELLDARRLTGPNLLGDLPGAVMDIQCPDNERDQIESKWCELITTAHLQLGWSLPELRALPLAGGLSVFFTAPIDHLYAATCVNEWAYECLVAHANGVAEPALDSNVVNEALMDEQNERLLELQTVAEQYHVTFLWDDDEVSLGQGCFSTTWPISDLPEPNALEFSEFQDIPTCVVTGTNGKTTTARIARFILQQAKRQVGMSCTDWIAVNDRIIDRGDWSGPGGARAVLREFEANCAVLETARGGLLRRGLGVNRADAAVITNIAADHLGDFGSRSLHELLQIKWIVSRAVQASGVLVLNADDALLVRQAEAYPGRIVWFTLSDVTSESNLLETGEAVYSLSAGDLVYVDHDGCRVICPVADVPLTLGGAAKHNVANALAAAALTHVMGISFADIAEGLMRMSQGDNPGRCNVYEVNGVSVLVDFAHNPHAMNALFDMALALPAKRRMLTFGQAGDRPDALIEDVTRAAWEIGLDYIQVTELPQYHRGRSHGEVFDIISKELLRLGAKVEHIRHCEEELEALETSLQWAEPGDLVIMLALGDRTAIADRLNELAAQH
jgi:cyanophycin synthetase